MTIKEQLNQIIQKYNLINATYDHFWRGYNNFLTENPDEAMEDGLIDSTSVKIKLYSVAYEIHEGERELLVIIIDLYNTTGKNAGKYLGYYAACYNLDGTLDDDYSVY